MSQTAMSYVKQHWASFLIALQFLTTLPIKTIDDYSKPTIGLSLLYYPLVGLLVGILLWATYALGQIFFSPIVCSAIVITVWVLLTGALHIDGLADCADAWVGGFGDRQRTLELMKDPTSGPVAVSVVVVVLLIKFTAVHDLILQDLGVWLVVVPVLGRSVSLGIFLTTPYIRKEGLGEVLVSHFSRRASVMLLLLCSIGLVLVQPLLVWVVAVWVIGVMFLRRLMMNRLGGCTGDTIGASIELTEVAVLLALASLITSLSP